jgi:hypothetical protein
VFGRRRNRRRLAVMLVLASVVIVIATSVFKPVEPSIDRSSYGLLLSVIAEGESGGNYNAYYGNPANESIKFTDMTIGQVLEWQDATVRQGSPSSAVGRYQIVRQTLAKLVSEVPVDPNQRYDEAMQDRLAIALLERRGSLGFISQKLSREQFAANLAQEWAALPRITGPNPHESYYAGDGLNAARISTDAVLSAIDALKPASSTN